MHTMKHLCFTSLREQMSENFNKVKDWRHDKKVISIHDAIMSGFACMFFQEPSLLRFQIRMQDEEKRNNFNSLFDVKNLPRETQMRDIIDLVDSEHFRPVFKNWYQRLQRGKQLEQYQAFSGLYYFPIDGSEFYSSNKIHCKQCLHKEHENGVLTHSHQILQGGIMHPDCSEVIPFMPEQIVNSDGADKQDCEINAAKRYIKKLSRDFPQLGFIIGGDDLFSREPLIQEIKELGMHFIFTAKPTSHKYMMEWLAAYPALNRDSFTDKKGRIHVYEWMNEVPLTGKKDPVVVNFFRCTIIGTDKKGKEKVVYKNNWVTDLGINTHNIRMFVKTGRCRWKVENECFNVMKNHGYCMEHSYGHGEKHLAFNFYLLTLLAFFTHQIFELTDKQYQACRTKFGSKELLWEKLRSWIDLFLFNTWEQLLAFALHPNKKELVQWIKAP